MKLNTIALFILMTSNCYADDFSFTVNANPINAACVKGNICGIYSKHQASITNNTDQPKYFMVTYSICAENAGACKNDTYKIKVNHGTWHDGKTMSLDTKYHFYGTKYFTCGTMITETDKKTVLKMVTKRGIIYIQ